MNSGHSVHPITGLMSIGHTKNGKAIYPIMGGDGNGDAPPPGSQDAGVPLVENGNPEWNDLLRYVPEDQRQEFVPYLQQYEEKLKEPIKEYEPYKDLISSGVDPETAQFAVEVLAKMQEDPRAIYDSLGEHFNWSNGAESEEDPSDQGKEKETGEGQQFEFDLEKNPAFQQLQKQNKVMADILLAQRNQELENQEQLNLDSEFEEAEKEFGKFSDEAEQYILMYMGHNDVSVKDAAQAYQKFVEKVGGRKPAPRLHGGSRGGAVPPPRIKPAQMSDKEAREAFVTMLTADREG